MLLLLKATAPMTDQRQHSVPKFAVVLILLLFVLLFMLHPTHLGTTPIVFILAACFLFGVVEIASCRCDWEETRFLPRATFRSALFDRPPPFFTV